MNREVGSAGVVSMAHQQSRQAHEETITNVTMSNDNQPRNWLENVSLRHAKINRQYDNNEHQSKRDHTQIAIAANPNRTILGQHAVGASGPAPRVMQPNVNMRPQPLNYALPVPANAYLSPNAPQPRRYVPLRPAVHVPVPLMVNAISGSPITVARYAYPYAYNQSNVPCFAQPQPPVLVLPSIQSAPTPVVLPVRAKSPPNVTDSNPRLQPTSSDRQPQNSDPVVSVNAIFSASRTNSSAGLSNAGSSALELPKSRLENETVAVTNEVDEVDELGLRRFICSNCMFRSNSRVIVAKHTKTAHQNASPKAVVRFLTTTELHKQLLRTALSHVSAQSTSSAQRTQPAAATESAAAPATNPEPNAKRMRLAPEAELPSDNRCLSASEINRQTQFGFAEIDGRDGCNPARSEPDAEFFDGVSIWSCAICGLEVLAGADGNARKRISTHLDVAHNHSQIYFCKVCKFGGDRRNVVRQHVDAEHKSTHFGHNVGRNALFVHRLSSNANKPDKAESAGSTFRSSHSVQMGQGSSDLTVSCSLNSEKSSSVDAEDVAAAISSQLYTCKLCRSLVYRTDSRDAIDTHLKTVHCLEASDSADSPFAIESCPSSMILRCVTCPYVTLHAGSYRRHVSYHEVPQHTTYQHFFKCRFCNYYAAAMSALPQHEVLHVDQYSPRPALPPANPSANLSVSVSVDQPVITSNSSQNVEPEPSQQQVADRAESSAKPTPLIQAEVEPRPPAPAKRTIKIVEIGSSSGPQSLFADKDELDEDLVDESMQIEYPSEQAKAENEQASTRKKARADSSAVKLYACDLCPYITHRAQDFASHVRPHQPRPGCNVRCPECPYWPRALSKLTKHSKVHQLFYYAQLIATLSRLNIESEIQSIIAHRAATAKERDSRIQELIQLAAKNRCAAEPGAAGISKETKKRRIRARNRKNLERTILESPKATSNGNQTAIVDTTPAHHNADVAASRVETPTLTVTTGGSSQNDLLDSDAPSDVSQCPSLACDVEDADYSALDRARLKYRLIRSRLYTRGARRLLAQLDDVVSQHDQRVDCETRPGESSSSKLQCTRCMFETASQTTLDAHSRQHEAPRLEESVRCVEPGCGFACTDVERLAEHLSDSHALGSVRQVRNNLSPSTDETPSVMRSAELLVSSSARCRHRAGIGTLSSHRRHNPLPLPPMQLNVRWGRGPVGRDVLMCEECPYSSRFPGRFAKHVTMHGAATAFHCRYCDYAAPEESSLNAHEALHVAPNENLLCLQPLARLAQLPTTDAPALTQVVDSLQTQKATARIDSGLLSELTALNIDRLATGEFRCPRCPFKDADHLALLRHLLRHAAFSGTASQTQSQDESLCTVPKASTSTVEKERTSDNSLCPFCDYYLSSTAEAKQHVALHIGHVPSLTRALADFELAAGANRAASFSSETDIVEAFLWTLRRRLARVRPASSVPAKAPRVCSYCNRKDFADDSVFRSHVQAHQTCVDESSVS